MDLWERGGEIPPRHPTHKLAGTATDPTGWRFILPLNK